MKVGFSPEESFAAQAANVGSQSQAESDLVNDDPTAGEVWKATADLEAAAATLLGRLLFAFSRLDVALGLCLVWTDSGKQIDALTPKVTALTFNQKLDSLTLLVKSKFSDGSKKRAAWVEWIEQAHVARTLRNELIHGRWGVDPYTSEAINVIGLPTSPEQREVRYSLQALTDAVTEIGRLQARLWQLREQRPV